MATTNHERVGRALELLKAGLGPFVEREMQRAVKAQRVGAAALRPFVDDPNVGARPVAEWDTTALLELMWETWAGRARLRRRAARPPERLGAPGAVLRRGFERE